MFHTAKKKEPKMNLASQRLMKEYQFLQKNKNPYIEAKPIDDSDYFHWEFTLKGPEDTPYSGGVYKGIMDFPSNYPYNPPVMKFKTAIWHPNIYKDGKICISILQTGAALGASPDEKWSPIQRIETVLLSVLSMLSEPNCSSPANIDAGVMYRRSLEEFSAYVKADIAREAVVVQEDVLDENLAAALGLSEEELALQRALMGNGR
jgi:ubiquitin-protein ligase